MCGGKNVSVCMCVCVSECEFECRYCMLYIV